VSGWTTTCPGSRHHTASSKALSLVVKAKLEAVEAGISTVEREFLADVLLADGSTVGAWAAPQLALVYERGVTPALLPGVSGRG
jgi:hypothetical protein